MRNVAFFFLISIVLLSCADKKPSANSVKDTIALMPVHLMDSIQNVFGNENWRIVNGKDTTYQYFSRRNDLLIHVYQYKMQHGDSVQSVLNKIYCTPKGILWQQDTDTFQLLNAKQNSNTWVHHSDTLQYQLILPVTIEQQFQGKRAIMQQTINLTDFLVRSRYDFLHGTHYANDTARFKRTVNKKTK